MAQETSLNEILCNIDNIIRNAGCKGYICTITLNDTTRIEVNTTFNNKEVGFK